MRLFVGRVLFLHVVQDEAHDIQMTLDGCVVKRSCAVLVPGVFVSHTLQNLLANVQQAAPTEIEVDNCLKSCLH